MLMCRPDHCRPCFGSDPAMDTVKVDVYSIARALSIEEQAEAAERFERQEHRRQVEEARKRAEAEAERQRAAGAEAERKRQQDEKDRRLTEQAAAAKAAEQQRSRDETESARSDQDARAKAEQERLEQERSAAELRQAEAKVDSFLKANGFKSVTSKKSSMMSGSSFPLHAAVSKNNPYIIVLLAMCKADPQKTNSSNKTPLQLAEASDRNGSHAKVLATLRSL